MLLLADTATTRQREAALSEADLMHRAAEAIWRCVMQHWPDALRILVVAGAGNNGEDGRLLARIAQDSGRAVTLINIAAQSGDTPALPEVDLIIDALTGIGLRGAPRAELLPWIEAINRSRAPVLSVDVPSGVNADTGHVAHTAVRASMTLQLLDRHQGLYTGDAKDHTGVLEFAPLVETGADRASVKCVDVADARAALPERRQNSHKGLFGHVCVVGGNLGMAGAGLITATAALRTGVGKVTWATRHENALQAWTVCPEVMSADLDSDNGLSDALRAADVVAVGPGLGQDASAQQWFEAVLRRAVPTVLDADALNLLAQAPVQLHAGCVLTPHPLEAARLLGCEVGDVQRDRYAAARAIAGRYDAVCILKGAGSVVSAPDGQVCVVAGGNPGMSVAGMGDALTGGVAALLAQLPDAFEAAWAAACFHAAAGDRVSETRGTRGLLARDLIDRLPEIMKA